MGGMGILRVCHSLTSDFATGRILETELPRGSTMVGTTTMQVSLGIKCMNKHYYNGFPPHIIEIHNPMLQIHGGLFHK
jgi:hypothetical protein